MQIEPKLFSPSVYFSISHRQFPNCAHVCVPIEVSLSLPVSVSGQESEGLWCLCVSVCIHTCLPLRRWSDAAALTRPLSLNTGRFHAYTMAESLWWSAAERRIWQKNSNCHIFCYYEFTLLCVPLQKGVADDAVKCSYSPRFYPLTMYLFTSVSALFVQLTMLPQLPLVNLQIL